MLPLSVLSELSASVIQMTINTNGTCTGESETRPTPPASGLTGAPGFEPLRR